jgi:transcriptional regulator with XRE-family HTH domain
VAKSKATRLNRVGMGNALKTAREARGWTVLEVAGMVGIDQHTLQRMEDGETNPEFRNLRDVILAVGVDYQTVWTAACAGLEPQP